MKTVIIGECCEDKIRATDHRKPEWWHNEEDEKCDSCGEAAEAIAYVTRVTEYRA